MVIDSTLGHRGDSLNLSVIGGDLGVIGDRGVIGDLCVVGDLGGASHNYDSCLQESEA